MTDEPSQAEAERHVPDPEQGKEPWYVVWLDVLVTFWKLWLIVGLVVAIAVVGIVTALGWSWPRQAKVALLTAIFVTPYGWLLKNKVRRLMWRDNLVYGVELRAEDPEAGGIWTWPAASFDRAEVEQYSLDWVHPRLFFARRIEDDQKEEGQKLEGTWRGSLEDRELLWALSKVAECRGGLVEDAARGFVIESSLWVTAFNGARGAVDELVEMIEDGTLPDKGEGLDAAVTSALEDSGLGDLVRNRHRDLDLDDELLAEEGSFANPFGDHEYTETARDAVGDVDGPDLDDLDLPNREGFADD